VSNSQGHLGSTRSGTASIAVRRLRRIRPSSRAHRVSLVGLLALSLAMLALVVSETGVSASPLSTTSLSVKGSLAATGQTSKSPAPTTASRTAKTAYPVGVVDSTAPSGYDPPTANALAGYTESYVTDFPGASLPNGWSAYNGSYAMDPGGQFDSAHAVVGGGMLSLNTSRDPAYGNQWATGGVCYCRAAPAYGALTYGAFFVRSRVTGLGPATVELLWPKSNSWPPEIDFNEMDGTTSSTMSSVHWGPGDYYFRRYLNNIDMTKWHTWGVIWTPTSIIYTVDGAVWSSVSSSSAQIPDVPMHLALQQQTWCGGSPAWACPSSPQSMQINWVAIYSPNS